MSKVKFSGLTERRLSMAEEMEILDRKSWEELEDQLCLRCPWQCRFDVHHFGIQERGWEWLIQRCCTWEEVERVLNWYKVNWKREGYRKIVTEGVLIFRCR